MDLPRTPWRKSRKFLAGLAALVANISGVDAGMATAASCAVEYPAVLDRIYVIRSDFVVTRMVWPSASAPVTARAPRLPAGPPRFSTTTRWRTPLPSRRRARRAVVGAA